MTWCPLTLESSGTGLTRPAWTIQMLGELEKFDSEQAVRFNSCVLLAGSGPYVYHRLSLITTALSVVFIPVLE